MSPLEPVALFVRLLDPPNVADAIPDGEFRVLCLQLADTDLNGVISKEEALAVRKIDCTPDPSYVKAISSLEGLHYFANLETLYCGGQLLTSICREIPVCAISIAPSIRSKNSM